MKSEQERITEALERADVAYASSQMMKELIIEMRDYAEDYHARHINWDAVKSGKEFEKIKSNNCTGITKFLEEEKYRVEYILDKSEVTSNRRVELVELLELWKKNAEKYYDKK